MKRFDNPLERGEVVDSRDVIDYLDDKETELENLKEETNSADFEEEISVLEEEIEKLKDFVAAGEMASEDWSYGTTLIPEDHFTEYAKQLCEDVGEIPKNIPSYIVIDWEATAENLKSDYAILEYGEYGFYIR